MILLLLLFCFCSFSASAVFFAFVAFLLLLLFYLCYLFLFFFVFVFLLFAFVAFLLWQLLSFIFLFLLFHLLALQRRNQTRKQASKQARAAHLWIWCAAGGGAAPRPTAPRATKSALHLRHPRLPRNQYFKVNSPVQKLLTNELCLLC